MREDKWDANNLKSKVVTKFSGPSSQLVGVTIKEGIEPFINTLAHKVGVADLYAESLPDYSGVGDYSTWK